MNQAVQKFRPHWGVFSSAAELPNVLGAPRQTVNLSVGDIAYVASALYVCIDATVGAAVWATVATQGSTLVLATRATAVSTVIAAATDFNIEADAALGGITITLPPLATSVGQLFNVIKVDATANVVTIDGDGTEPINGELTQGLIAQYDSVTLIGNAAGTGWLII